MFNHILVPLDESNRAEAALNYACEIVPPYGKITLLEVVDITELEAIVPGPYPGVMGSQDYHLNQRERLQHAASYLESVQAQLRCEQIDTNCLTRCGDAAHIIVDTARELRVDAVVMSTHGRTGFSRMLYGSVTEQVLKQAHCPVLVVPKGCR